MNSQRDSWVISCLMVWWGRKWYGRRNKVAVKLVAENNRKIKIPFSVFFFVFRFWKNLKSKCILTIELAQFSSVCGRMWLLWSYLEWPPPVPAFLRQYWNIAILEERFVCLWRLRAYPMIIFVRRFILCISYVSIWALSLGQTNSTQRKKRLISKNQRLSSIIVVQFEAPPS